MSTISIRTDPGVLPAFDTPRPELTIDVRPDVNSCVVHVAGELDLATRNQLFIASTAGTHPFMVIDLAGLTFMDCSGFGSIVASRLVIEAQGRQLDIRRASGQPARLFDLIAGTYSSSR